MRTNAFSLKPSGSRSRSAVLVAAIAALSPLIFSATLPAEIVMKVDIPVTIPVNIAPLVDDNDFVAVQDSLTDASPGLELTWNFVTTDGVMSQVAVTATSTGSYDWLAAGSEGKGMYKIEMPASGGSPNNDTEGFGWFTGKADDVAPWRGPTITFVSENVADSTINGTDKLHVDAREFSGNATAATQIAETFDNDGTGGDMDLSSLTVTGNTAFDGTTTHTGNVALLNGASISQATVNGVGLSVSGNGNGSGISVGGGETGTGVSILGGATSGDAVRFATTDGQGLYINADGTDKDAIRIASYDGSGIDVHSSGDTAVKIEADGGPIGVSITSEDDYGLRIATQDGDSAVAIETSSEGHGHGLSITGGTNGDAIHLQGVGTGNGLYSNGGATGHDILASLNGSVVSVVSGVALANAAISAAKFDLSTAFPLEAADSGTTTILRKGSGMITGASIDGKLDAVNTDVDGVSSALGAVSGVVDAIFAFLDGAPTFGQAMDDHGYLTSRAEKIDRLAPTLLFTGVVDGAPDTQTSLVLVEGPPDDRSLNGALVIITDSEIESKKAVAIAKNYDAGTKTLTLVTDPGVFEIGDEDRVDVIATGEPAALWLGSTP